MILQSIAAVVVFAGDALEVKALDAVLRLSDAVGVKTLSMGVGGSILLGSHNPHFSDINIIVYGCRDALNVALAEETRLDPMPQQTLTRRIRNKSRLHGLPPDVVEDLIPSYRRVAVGGTPVGITFVDSMPGRYGEEVLKPVARVKCEAYVEGGDCGSLFYPSRTKVSECRFRKVEGLPAEDLRPDEVSEVLNYEGLFNYALFRGGYVKIEGILERRYPGGDAVILVGGKEHPGYVIPC
jgi:predicted nucleotidyltransferase